jgi:hypothetical protein
MEMRFPTAVAYAGAFVAGYRKSAAGQVERTGTVVLKRTYDIDPGTGDLTPSAAAMPLFVKDQPDNQVFNGDFELSQQDLDPSGSATVPAAWTATGASVALSGAPGGRTLTVGGAPTGRVIQAIAFERPLGGRQFTLSFAVRTDVAPVMPVQCVDAHLEADGSAPICAITAPVTAAPARLSATGTWPADLGATEMRVVLRPPARSAGDSTAVALLYGAVQVEERGVPTVFAPQTTFRYEHDLVPFKPEGDVVVLGFTSLAVEGRLRVDGDLRLRRTIANAGGREKALFGWQPRLTAPRRDQAGDVAAAATAVPPVPLPGDFDNRFFNGSLRPPVAQTSPARYLPAAAEIRIERDTAVDYRVRLRGDRAAATYHVYSGTGPDQETAWDQRAIDMDLDTLVVEPEVHRCYAVWRGAWPLDQHPEGAYRRLVVDASG